MTIRRAVTADLDVPADLADGSCASDGYDNAAGTPIVMAEEIR